MIADNINSVWIMTEIRRECKRNFGDQRTDMHKELCTV